MLTYVNIIKLIRKSFLTKLLTYLDIANNLILEELTFHKASVQVLIQSLNPL